jgi:hypothetical protein
MIRRYANLEIQSLFAVVPVLLACVSGEQKHENAEFPKDQPIHCESGKGASLREAMEPYVAKARQTYPEARSRWSKGLPSDQRFFITTLFHHESGRDEQVFVLVDRIECGVISGRIGNEPMSPGFKLWDPYSFRERELLDWTIQHSDGTEEGNFVDRYHSQCPDRCMLQTWALEASAAGS